MNKELMIFKNKEVEVFNWNGQVLFNPKHVAECLDIKDVNSSIRNFSEKQMIKLRNLDMHNMLNRKLNNAGEKFLTESGVYKLIFKSKKKEAEEFQDWVTDEVLPTLRKEGSYSLTENNSNSELQIIGQNILTQVKELMMDTVKNINKRVDRLDNNIEKLEQKQDELETYYKPTHRNKLGYNSFIKSCLGDNATKENCEQAKFQLLFLLGDYETYQEVPKDTLESMNTKALAYDICKNINNSIKECI
ncbi:Bro-N domain-containing protein [Clostridium sp. VAP52]|uniref:BRO-N domain-containing protein n=1 Tax=Clostridium sp. VAP52 TaxID=2949977 RepID=UPI002079F738|nr:Bro-N domain-containing protein [Clostridium sp. VAP52]